MVFQNYSLYPHFTVYENIAFPLKNLHVPRDEIDERVKNIAATLGIDGLLERRPKDLSGGERQRVAIGRAVIRKPRLFLLDEPFSNLDAPMRNRLRQQIRMLHAKLRTTFVYVTHDQTEAFMLGETLVVMNEGMITQTGTAEEIYNRPADEFTASFINRSETDR
jgi:multiple sugar transport system ATP-binding protein